LKYNISSHILSMLFSFKNRFEIHQNSEKHNNYANNNKIILYLLLQDLFSGKSNERINISNEYYSTTKQIYKEKIIE
jgi:hypothetical protein